jgi:hypothetical protein
VRGAERAAGREAPGLRRRRARVRAPRKLPPRRGNGSRVSRDTRARNRTGRHARFAHGGIRSPASAARDGPVHPRSPRDVRHVMVIVNDVGVDVRMEEVVAVAEDVGRGSGKPQRDGGPIDPDVAWRHRRPADVRVVGRGHAPNDPGGGVLSPRNPGPAGAGDPHPAPVVKHHPAEGIAADPDPVALGGLRPVTVGDVGREVATDRTFIRHPHDAVGRVVEPASVGSQRGAEVRERARIGIDVLVARRRPGRVGCLCRSDVLRRRAHVAVFPLLSSSGRARKHARKHGGGRDHC